MERGSKAQAVFDALTKSEDDIYYQCQICVEIRLFSWPYKYIKYDVDTGELMHRLCCRVCLKARWIPGKEHEHEQRRQA